MFPDPRGLLLSRECPAAQTYYLLQTIYIPCFLFDFKTSLFSNISKMRSSFNLDPSRDKRKFISALRYAFPQSSIALYHSVVWADDSIE